MNLFMIQFNYQSKCCRQYLPLFFYFNEFLSLRWKPILLVNVFRLSVLTNDLLDHLNMIAFGFLLVTVLCSLQVHGHVSHTVQPAKNHKEIMKQLKDNSKILDAELEQLKSNQNQLKVYFEQHKANCTTELKTIADKNKQAINKGSESINAMYELLKALVQEENVQIELTKELEKLSTVLELFQIQYSVLAGDLKLLKDRKLNGSLDRCNEIATALKAELIKIRSGFARNPLTFVKTRTNEELARMQAESDVRMKTTINKNANSDLKQLNDQFEKEKQKCFDEKKKNHAVLQEAMSHQATSQNSKIVIEQLLKNAVEHSHVIRLELKTGREFVRRLTEKVSKLRSAIMQYKGDSACYKAIEESV